MHVTALELLSERLQPGARVLDVGSVRATGWACREVRFKTAERLLRVQGSGYLTACFAYACRSGAYVLGIEKHEDLVAASLENIRKADGELLDSGQVELRYGNALAGVERFWVGGVVLLWRAPLSGARERRPLASIMPPPSSA